MANYKKPDHWQLKARKEGYPARSVYKLMEIDEKFGLFKMVKGKTHRILDLGAAPGSWSLYVLRKMEGRGFLAAADISPLSGEFVNDSKNSQLFNGENFFFVQGDITVADIRQELMEKGPYTVIICDAAPSTTGNRLVDTTRSQQLVEEAINYAETALAAGGNIAVKVFQSGDSTALLKRMKTLFKTAKSFKPLACRGESVETYFVGLDRITPS